MLDLQAVHARLRAILATLTEKSVARQPALVEALLASRAPKR